MNLVLARSILFVFIIIASANDDVCPSKCICKRQTQRDKSIYIKLRCGDEDSKILHLDEIDLLNIASEIVHLNLSNNLLTAFYPKVQLIALQKLDLSKNRLTELKNDEFAEFPNLRRLDLSSNNIKTIQILAFSKLNYLDRLKLNQNQISSVALNTFDPLTNLKQLDISNNPLTCDCSLLWLLEWSQKQLVKLVSNPTCSNPASFKGLLRKLKIGVDIHCKSPALNNNLPLIDMKPDENQVVFEGDTLKLRCTAPNIFDSYDSPPSSKIEWTWLDSDPNFYFNDISIENNLLKSSGYISSTLEIPKLVRNHTGIWNCLLVSTQANFSKGITIVVISDSTQYCPITTTTSNKGTYTWPRTVVNYTATIRCEYVNFNFDLTHQKASYFCSENGQWEGLNSSGCAYISETTRILQQFSNVNSSVMESAKHFRNYTSNLTHFQDSADVYFAVKTMDNYLAFLSVNLIGGVLMDVINSLMELPKKYLREAQYLYRSCEVLVNITERLAAFGSTSLLHKSNIATEIFPLKKIGFSGLKCTWYVDLQKSTQRLFYCVTNSQTDTTELHGKITEASITVPETLFTQLEKQNYRLHDKIYQILISMYSNNNLFPMTEDHDTRDVTTAVVGVKLDEAPILNLTDPIFIMLRVPKLYPSVESPIQPVWWDPRLNNNSGSWSTEGCHFSHEYQDNVVFYCHNLGYYGLMQDVAYLAQTRATALFKFSHPAIYVGSFLLFTSLLVAIVTYLLAYPTIQMPKKAKHALINLWIAVCFLIFFYVFGIYQTEDLQVCQIVGMALHYTTLASLLWICVGVNCMYKRLSKHDILALQDDELPSDQPIKKPILGLYFVGWGIPIIICGISAAINIREYASSTYCFLRIGPPVSALYIPVTILLVFLGIFFLLIRCAINNMDSNGHLSEGTQATENVDLDLLEPNFSPDSRSVLTMSSKTASSEVEDLEHAPAAQLKAYVIFLALYVLAWLSCGFATAESNYTILTNDLFSIVYAMLATILSAFTLFFYCVARSDVRGQWLVLANWLKRRYCFRSRTVSDATPTIPQIQIQPLPLPPISNSLVGELQLQAASTRSSSRSSSRTKSNSAKAAADLNGSYSGTYGAKINNVNLLVLHRQQYRTAAIPNIIENPTSADVFYNPQQSIVARKFFKRQKRHQMKRNNLVPRPRDSDSASVLSDIKQMKGNSNLDHIFGTTSKVNNTNIHVEHVHKMQHRNPNLFSDSGEEHDAPSHVPVQHLVDNLRKRDRSRKNRDNTASIGNNMRSVSQQCTLEYSSDMSDSILDKLSPSEALGKRDDVLSVLTEDPGYAKLTDNKASEGSLSVLGSQVSDVGPRVFLNPAHDVAFRKGVQSRASSVSVSDLDELYQQIRRGPKESASFPRYFVNDDSLTRNSPCFSDSDVASFVQEHRRGHYGSPNNLTDDVETTV